MRPAAKQSKQQRRRQRRRNQPPGNAESSKRMQDGSFILPSSATSLESPSNMLLGRPKPGSSFAASRTMQGRGTSWTVLGPNDFERLAPGDQQKKRWHGLVFLLIFHRASKESRGARFLPSAEACRSTDMRVTVSYWGTLLHSYIIDHNNELRPDHPFFEFNIASPIIYNAWIP